MHARPLVLAFVAILVAGPAFAGTGLSSDTRRTDTVPERAERANRAAEAAATGANDNARIEDDIDRYQAREQASQGLEEWNGGAAIYIGGSAVALVLLLLLLIAI